MNDIDYFKSGANQLSFRCWAPGWCERGTGIVFVHAAGGNRLGPHRMFVEMAQTFSELGYATFRFDLSGCGDSTGVESREDTAGSVKDLVNAIRHFRASQKQDRIVVFAISRGARVAFEAMVHHKLPLAGMILLSLPCSSRRSGWRNLSVYLRDYAQKLKDPQVWWKMVKGRVNPIGVGQTLAHAWNLGKRYRKIEGSGFTSPCPVLLIYGEYDPITDEASVYYLQKCRDNGLQVESHIIAQANHSFFHYRWKEEILDIALRWLEKRVRG